MRHSRASFLVLLFTCLVAGLAAAGPLADFVNVPDPNYQYEITGTYDGCLLYTSDAADDLLCVDLGGRRTIKKKKQKR